jgi:SAM-dependent methyltransferase
MPAVTSQYAIGCNVVSIDLTGEYCDVARWLDAAVGLDHLIEVYQVDALDLPFAEGSFDVVASQHVQMNVSDKARLYREARRALALGGRLALWDVTAGPSQPLRFPVPWADSAELSHLVTPEELRTLVTDAGLEVIAWNDLTGRSARQPGPRRPALPAPPRRPPGLRETPMRTRKVEFAGSQGAALAARLELPEGRPRGYALFAHCFTCGKDQVAATRIARALTESGIAVLQPGFRRTKDLPGFDRMPGSLAFRAELSVLVPEARREKPRRRRLRVRTGAIGTDKYCRGGS